VRGSIFIAADLGQVLDRVEDVDGVHALHEDVDVHELAPPFV
jgi:hypothetical protein